MNSVRCVECEKFSLKRVLPHDAKAGKGHCALRQPFIRHRAMVERGCESFIGVPIETRRARIEYLQKAGAA